MASVNIVARASRAAAAFVAAGLLVSALAACGTTQNGTPTPASTQGQVVKIGPKDPNGVQKLGSSKLVARVLSDIQRAGAVHLSGKYTEPPQRDENGQPVTNPAPPDITLDYRGTVSRFDLKFTVSTGVSGELRRVSGVVYATGNQAFAALLKNPAVANGFVSYKPTDPALAPWLSFTDMNTLFTSILQPPSTDVSFSAGSVSNKKFDLAVTAKSSSAGKITISAVGLAVPLALAVSDDTGSATFTLSDWGKTPVIVKP